MIKFLHSMIRVVDVDASLFFYVELLGLKLIRNKNYEAGRFSLYYLATDHGEPEIELTHNWDGGSYIAGDAFGHLAFQVENIYAICEKLEANGVTILRPPRDGRMAFVKDPSGISIELLQLGNSLPSSEKWNAMPNVGSW